VSSWDVAAYGPDRALIGSATVNDDGELSEPLQVPAGGYLWVRPGAAAGWPTTPVPMDRQFTVERIKAIR
jgi:hypothetical protein